MIDFSEARITKLSIHHLDHDGARGLSISSTSTPLPDSATLSLLEKFAFGHFIKRLEHYEFTWSNGDASLNPMKILSDQVFQQQETFHQTSISIAKHLFQSSSHPNIKSGDFIMIYVQDVRAEDELIDAIGIFKSESKTSFLKILSEGSHSSLTGDEGININAIDKGCLVFNIHAESGYLVQSIDRSNRSQEAQYWTDSFLQLQRRSDAFLHTQQYMNLTQTYVSHQLAEEFDIDRADQLDLLRRTGEYFKSHDRYDSQEFESEVLSDESVIQSYRSYKDTFQKELQTELPDTVGLSKQAVRRSAKDFKSVLKLDKNFHIYIHGDRDLIQSGTDPDGRKWYKVYYDEVR
ncbi:MAG: nucleoid-associated protein [Bacteroidota bacterium]